MFNSGWNEKKQSKVEEEEKMDPLNTIDHLIDPKKSSEPVLDSPWV